MTSLSRLPELRPVRVEADTFSDRILSGLGSALDRAVLRATQVAVDALLMPRPEELPALQASARALLDPALLRDPARFFAFGRPPAPASVRSRTLRRLRGGRVVAREIGFEYRPSGIEPRSRAVVRDRLLLQHWTHTGRRARPSVVAVHGYRMGRPRIDALALMVRQWFRHGLDVALVTLPYHGERTPREARFSGEHFAVPHAARLAEAVRQAVFELRLLHAWLRERGASAVGFLGQSLGGYLVALLAGLYDDLDFAIPIVPPVCMGDLAWRFFRRSRRYRRGLPASFSREELRAAFRVHSPLAHPLRTARERVLLVAGLGDRIVPPEHPSALWRHWGRPAIHWFEGSHLAPFGRAGIVQAVTRHLSRLGVLDPAVVAVAPG